MLGLFPGKIIEYYLKIIHQYTLEVFEQQQLKYGKIRAQMSKSKTYCGTILQCDPHQSITFAD